jgi:hypothetical protein
MSDDQQDATILYPFIYSPLYMFRAIRFLRPSSGAHNGIYSFRYCPPILLLAGIVEEMIHLIHDTSQQQYR